MYSIISTCHSDSESKLFLAVEDPSDDDDWGDDDDDEEDRGGADGYQLLPQDLQQLQDQGPGGTEQG